MSVEPTATGAPASGPASAVPAIASPALQSLRSTWSSLSRQAKAIIGIAVVAFLVIGAVVAMTVIGAVASRLIGGGSSLRAQVASVDTSPAAQRSNRKINDLRVTKDVGDGTVRVQFRLKGSPEGGPIAAGRFLVRIFDANGQFLHAATSDTLVEMYGADPSSYWKDREVDVQFSTNAMMLREAKMAEVGFVF